MEAAQRQRWQTQHQHRCESYERVSTARRGRRMNATSKKKRKTQNHRRKKAHTSREVSECCRRGEGRRARKKRERKAARNSRARAQGWSYKSVELEEGVRACPETACRYFIGETSEITTGARARPPPPPGIRACQAHGPFRSKTESKSTETHGAILSAGAAGEVTHEAGGERSWPSRRAKSSSSRLILRQKPRGIPSHR